MNMPEDLIAVEIDAIITRSTLRMQEHRTRIAELTGQHALLAENVISDMLAALVRLRAYRAKFS
jgi:hypothetical protein